MDPTTISSLTTVGYTGGELIAEANLIQMGARLYDPASGVFLTPDPTVAAPFDARDWNQYAYVYDNPMSYTDPTGYAEQGPGSPIILGSVTVFAPWSQNTLDCMSFANQMNPACHAAIYGVPPNYGNDDVFLALAARADAMAKAAEKKKAVEKVKLPSCKDSSPSILGNAQQGIYGAFGVKLTKLIGFDFDVNLGSYVTPLNGDTYWSHGISVVLNIGPIKIGGSWEQASYNGGLTFESRPSNFIIANLNSSSDGISWVIKPPQAFSGGEISVNHLETLFESCKP